MRPCHEVGGLSRSTQVALTWRLVATTSSSLATHSASLRFSVQTTFRFAPKKNMTMRVVWGYEQVWRLLFLDDAGGIRGSEISRRRRRRRRRIVSRHLGLTGVDCHREQAPLASNWLVLQIEIELHALARVK